MESYLKILASTFAREVGVDNISKYAFVFPNRRAGLFFRKYLAEALSRPVLSPAILTINDCFYELSDLRLADELDLLFRVYDTYFDIMGKQGDVESFDTFLFWGKMMLSDFSEIDNHLIPNVRELFTTIRDLKQIEQQFAYLTEGQKDAISEFWSDFLKSEKQTGDINRKFLYIWEILYPVYESLRSRLLEEGLAYDGLLHRELIEHWEDIPAEKLREKYVFIGFNALTGSEEQLMLRLQQEGRADFYFDYHSPWLQDEENRASLFMKDNLSRFRSHYDISAQLPDFGKKDITLISIPSTVGETHEVHRILKDIYPFELTRTAVVLPDERMLLPMLTAIPEEVDKVNVTMGYPLSATPVFALLRLLESLRARMTSAGFYHKDVVAVLSHRYVRQALGEQADDIIARISETNMVYIPEEHLPQPFFRSGEPTLPYLMEVLRALPATDSEELYQVQRALNRIEESLNWWKQKSKIAPEEKTIFSLITLMLGGMTIPYVGEPLHGLQVMGVLETRALDFDNVIITGFNDELYPGNSRGNSFVPYILRRGFGLPTPERQDAIFAYNFYRMLSYAQRVWFITNSRADDQHSGEPSRYLAQLYYQYRVPIHRVTVVPGAGVVNGEQGSDEVQKTPSMIETIRRSAAVGGKHGLSPSALNGYQRCQMQFYWRYVMGVHEPKEITDDINERDLGTVMHKVLELLYEPYLKSEVSQKQIEDMRPRVPSLITKAAEMYQIELTNLSVQVLQEFISLILDKDMAAAPFIYLASEQDVKMALPLSDGTSVLLEGKIDRIDKRGLSTRIVDYKSGKAELEFESVEALFDVKGNKLNHYALQTIFYCLLSGYENAEPHIYAVRKSAAESTMLRQKGRADFDMREVRDEYVTRLTALIEEILNPSVPFVKTPDSRNCEQCCYKQLCKR